MKEDKELNIILDRIRRYGPLSALGILALVIFSAFIVYQALFFIPSHWQWSWNASDWQMSSRKMSVRVLISICLGPPLGFYLGYRLILWRLKIETSKRKEGEPS